MKYKSEILEVLHENAVEMYKIGGITEASMREYDEMCLVSTNAECSNVEQESASVYNENNKNVNLDHISHATA